MRCAIGLVTVLACLATEVSAEVPECQPHRAIISIDPLPKIPADGRVEVAFTISPSGKPQDLVLVLSEIDWPGATDLALKAVASAQFDPPSEACRQKLMIRFMQHL